MPITISKASLALVPLSRCCSRRKCPFGHVMEDIVEEVEEGSHNEGLEVVVEGGGEGSEGLAIEPCRRRARAHGGKDFRGRWWTNRLCYRHH